MRLLLRPVARMLDRVSQMCEPTFEDRPTGDELDAVLERTFEAGRAIGIAEERFRIRAAEGRLGEAVYQAGCMAALDQANAAVDEIGKDLRDAAGA